MLIENSILIFLIFLFSRSMWALQQKIRRYPADGETKSTNSGASRGNDGTGTEQSWFAKRIDELGSRSGIKLINYIYASNLNGKNADLQLEMQNNYFESKARIDEIE